MKFHIVTIFPEFFRGPFEHGVIQKAREAGRIEIQVHDLRTWTYDRHRTVDDRPFGGGEGMLLKAKPIFEAVEAVWPERANRGVAEKDAVWPERADRGAAEKDAVWPERADRGAADTEIVEPEIVEPAAGKRKKVVLLTPQGRKFDQKVAREYSGLDELLLICGRYEGVDERVATYLADEELSIGDYVLSGGELAAAVVVDSVARLVEGVLGNETSHVDESFGEEGLLDWPQYTRPAEFRGWKVPDTLVGGNHEEIRKWRRKAAREKTARLRPDLLAAGEPETEPR